MRRLLKIGKEKSIKRVINDNLTDKIHHFQDKKLKFLKEIIKKDHLRKNVNNNNIKSKINIIRFNKPYVIKIDEYFLDFQSLAYFCGEKTDQKGNRYHQHSQYQQHDASTNLGPLINGSCYFRDVKLNRPCYNCYEIYSQYKVRIDQKQNHLNVNMNQNQDPVVLLF